MKRDLPERLCLVFSAAQATSEAGRLLSDTVNGDARAQQEKTPVSKQASRQIFGAAQPHAEHTSTHTVDHRSAVCLQAVRAAVQEFASKLEGVAALEGAFATLQE